MASLATDNGRGNHRREGMLVYMVSIATNNDRGQSRDSYDLILQSSHSIKTTVILCCLGNPRQTDRSLALYLMLSRATELAMNT